MPVLPSFSLVDFVVATYCALDDALLAAGVQAQNGKLLSRRGAAPDVDDREILCLAILQELLHFKSDNAFHDWFNANPVMCELFPRRLTRQNFADRRALLTPLMEKLCGSLCAVNGEADPPFSSPIPIRSKSADAFGRATRNGSVGWRKPVIARRCAMDSMACANI